MNKEIEDALCMLLHCSLKDKEYTTQKEQFEYVYKYVEQLQQENQQLKEQLKKGWKPTPDDLVDMLNQELLNQLKQRDEVIDDAINTIKDTCIEQIPDMPIGCYRETASADDLLELLEILQRYKGDNNE